MDDDCPGSVWPAVMVKGLFYFSLNLVPRGSTAASVTVKDDNGVVIAVGEVGEAGCSSRPATGVTVVVREDVELDLTNA